MTTSLVSLLWMVMELCLGPYQGILEKCCTSSLLIYPRNMVRRHGLWIFTCSRFIVGVQTFRSVHMELFQDWLCCQFLTSVLFLYFGTFFFFHNSIILMSAKEWKNISVTSCFKVVVRCHFTLVTSIYVPPSSF